jgi:hypothetical protein
MGLEWQCLYSDIQYKIVFGGETGSFIVPETPSCLPISFQCNRIKVCSKGIRNARIDACQEYES